MHIKSSLLIALCASASALALGIKRDTDSKKSTSLIASAIVTNAQGNSALQCWEYAVPFTVSTGAGTAGASTLQLGQLANATYTVIPPHFEGGIHNAPFAQLVVFTSGLAHVHLPHSSQSVTVEGGINGLLFAVDTHGTGHNTSYTSGDTTIALQIPFEGGVIPAHTVLNAWGPCPSGSQIVPLI